MVHYKVIASEASGKDFHDISRYILDQLAPVTVLQMIEAIGKALMSLSQIPYRCPLVDDERLAAMGYRCLPTKSYLAFFVIDEQMKTVSVERILYARRDWLHIL